MSSTTTARDGALAQLAAEAARFAESPPPTPPRVATPRQVEPPTRLRASQPATASAEPRSTVGGEGYVPVAVAPERGNTRPVVPVDGRLHMRVARATLDELDGVVSGWKKRHAAALRDLERATLVRIGLAMVLADVAQNGEKGAVGEAVRAALDPAVRHTAVAMPDLSRWMTTPDLSGEHQRASVNAETARSASVSFGSQQPGSPTPIAGQEPVPA